MKRDMDLVRKILLAMEPWEHQSGFVQAFTFTDYDQRVIGHHVWLMGQGDLITAMPVTVVGSEPPVALPLAITWAGHQFLDAVRDDTVWAEVNRRLKAQGLSLPSTLLQQLALKILAGQVGL